MSGQLATVITYYADPVEQRSLEIKAERLRENRRRDAAAKQRGPLVPERAQSDCGSIRNPWFVRCGVVFAGVVFAVIFVALYSKVHAKIGRIHLELRHAESTLFGLEQRIHCSVVWANGTDKRGKPCSQYVAAQEAVGARPTRTAQSTTLPRQTTPTTQRQTASTNGRDRSRRARPSAVYVAWGVARCPDSSKTLYSGLVACSRQSAFLCLSDNFYHENPENISHADRVQLHPVRYGDAMVLFRPKWNRAPNYARNDMDVPCAVCAHSGRSAVLVQPAATNCPTASWQREYRGYLMTSEGPDTRREFICVNIYAESKAASYDRLQGAVTRLQLTQYRYEPAEEPGAALACVVCLI